MTNTMTKNEVVDLNEMWKEMAKKYRASRPVEDEPVVYYEYYDGYVDLPNGKCTLARDKFC